MRENLTSGSMRGSRGGTLGGYGKADYALHPKGWRQGSSMPETAGKQPILFPTLRKSSRNSEESKSSKEQLNKPGTRSIVGFAELTTEVAKLEDEVITQTEDLQEAVDRAPGTPSPPEDIAGAD